MVSSNNSTHFLDPSNQSLNQYSDSNGDKRYDSGGQYLYSTDVTAKPSGNSAMSRHYSNMMKQSDPGLTSQSTAAQLMAASNFYRKDMASSSAQSWASASSLPSYSYSAPQTMYDQHFGQNNLASPQFSKTFTGSHKFADPTKLASSRSSLNKDPPKGVMSQSQYVSEPPGSISEQSIEQDFATNSLGKSQIFQEASQILPEPSQIPPKRPSILKKEKDTPSRSVAFESTNKRQDRNISTRSKAQTPLKQGKASTQPKAIATQSKTLTVTNDSTSLSQNKVFQKISQKISNKQSISNISAQSYPRSDESMREPVETNQSISQIQSSKQRNRSLSQERKKPVVVITKVNEALKKKILEWLFSITFLKESAKDLEIKLPKICKNGVIFADLINRLEGRNDTIKGITRHPETKTQINVNYSKAFSYLRQQQKMNPRYLWAEDYLMEGNDDVFWGLIFDIWCFYSQKVSPYDPRYKGSTTEVFDQSVSKISKSEQSTLSTFHRDPYEESLYTRSKSKTLLVSPKGQGTSNRTQDYSAIYIKDSAVISPNLTRRESAKSVRFSKGKQRTAPQPSYGSDSKVLNTSTASKENTLCLTGSPKALTKSQLFSRSLTSRSFRTGLSADKSGFMDEKSTDYVPVKVSHENIITFDMQQDVELWLQQLGLASYLLRRDCSLFKDPFRNGVLLVNILSKIENEKIQTFYSNPETIEQCRKNIYSTLELLRKRKTPIPYRFSKQEEAILQGDHNVIWGLLYSLMKISREKENLDRTLYSSLYSPSKSIGQDFSGKILPYSEEEIKRLEISILNWVIRIGLFGETHDLPLTFEELEVQLRNGAKFCELIEIVTKIQVFAYTKKPKNEAQSIGNIRRGLETLRANKNMSQKHTWKEKELHKGSKYYLLGLLEDLHRLFDGLPPRIEPNYYSDGPYFGDDDNNDKCFSSEQGKMFETFVEKKALASKLQNGNSQSRFFSSQAYQTADFARFSQKIQPDSPISLLDMNKLPINLANYSSIETSKEFNDVSLTQRRSIPTQEKNLVTSSRIELNSNRYAKTELKVN